MGHRADRRRCFRARGHADQDVLAQLCPVHLWPRSGPRAYPARSPRRRSNVVSKSLPVSPFWWSVWSSSTLRAGGWPSITPNPNSPLRPPKRRPRSSSRLGTNASRSRVHARPAGCRKRAARRARVTSSSNETAVAVRGPATRAHGGGRPQQQQPPGLFCGPQPPRTSLARSPDDESRSKQSNG